MRFYSYIVEILPKMSNLVGLPDIPPPRGWGKPLTGALQVLLKTYFETNILHVSFKNVQFDKSLQCVMHSENCNKLTKTI